MAAHVLDGGRTVPTQPSGDVRRLSSLLDEALPGLQRSDRYYAGTVPSILAVRERLQASRLSALTGLSASWSALAVDAVAERLQPEGFRLPGASQTDEAMAEAWRAAGGAEVAPTAVLEALVHGRSALLVWADERGRPRVTVESALSCVVTPGSALKRWRDEDGYARALHMTPTVVRRLRSSNHVPGEDLGAITSWETLEVLPNPLGRLPLVPILCRGRLADSQGASVLTRGLTDLQDALAKLVVDLLVASEAASQPRRWVTGLEVPIGPDGEPVDPFADAGPGRLFLAEDAAAKFGSFDPADLTGLLAAIRAVTEHLCALASIPPHLALGASSGQQVSAESVRAAEASLVSKVRRIALGMGAGFAEAQRLVLLVRDGFLPTGADRLETVWADPQADTLGQQADALVKLAPFVPVAALLREVMGWSPSQVAAAMADATPSPAVPA